MPCGVIAGFEFVLVSAWVQRWCVAGAGAKAAARVGFRAPDFDGAELCDIEVGVGPAKFSPA